MEIIYISVQITMYTLIVYWMCWFQRDAGQLPFALSLTGNIMKEVCVSKLNMLHVQPE